LSSYSSQWQPVSQAADKFATNKNIGISAALLASFFILLIIAIYLAIKYRRKLEESQDLREFELDNLTRNHIAVNRYQYQDVPPDYYTVVKKIICDVSLPDYEDEMVEKVLV